MDYYLLTLGCPKNMVDSEAMATLLGSEGHHAVSDPANADVLIVNTCGFLDVARQEALQELRALAEAKRPSQYLIAAGCLPQRDGLDIIREVPKVDGLLGTRRWMDIVTLLRELDTGRAKDNAGPLVYTGDPDTQISEPIERPATSGWAYLKISDGCDAACGFCTIPLIKGPMRSRPIPALVQEASQLVQLGAQEIILIGQDTTAYGRDMGRREGLSELIEAILSYLPELHWLRVMYGYPGHITDRLIATMAGNPRVCHYLDLPLQHAHPDTLRRMRRPASPRATLGLIERLRRAMPDIALRSTFIVGYPGETEEEFRTLVEFVEQVRFDKVGVFEYSAEEDTEAARLPRQKGAEVKRQRYERLMEAQQPISLARNRAQIGKTLDVLVEGKGDGLSVGRCYRDAPEIDGLVLVDEELDMARIVPVHITGAMEYDLLGEVA